MARWACDGSNTEPLPFTVDEFGLRETRWTTSQGGTMIVSHDVDRGVCPVCHEPKRLLKSGRLPKHTRYVSWQEQKEASR